ncbi:phage tail protein I [uncultured Acidaminococcus sp.]|uniref:phage tail protein I n=1 Tax=uncultured Acidaminococcus sp. TaxID=352152 RepID=UPI002666190B|nr:phage tail protein I [uncultured Acidaminococcus sp.]
MKTVKTVRVEDLLPSSLARSQTVRDVAKACGASLHDVVDRMSGLLIYSRIDELDESVVDDLAWQFHVDFYDTGLNLIQKRALVKSAIKDHKYKGTTWAVKCVLKPIRGNVVLQDWYQYSGEPYHFRVNGFSGAMVSADELTRLVAAIDSAKNVRSWLDGVSFDRTIQASKRLAIPLMLTKSIVIPIPKVAPPNVVATKHMTGALGLLKEVHIHG